MNEYNLKNAAVFLQDNLNDAINFIYWQRYFMALDIIDSKIFKLPISKIFFLNRSLELINVPGIFHHHQ